MGDFFLKASGWTSRKAGHPLAFALAILTILVWGITGPLFHFSDTWQLVINTGTTIVTFLMVFLIQATQNRDTLAIQLKLAELIRAVEGAHNALLDVEELSEQDLDEIKAHYRELAEKARRKLSQGEADTNCPEVGNPQLSASAQAQAQAAKNRKAVPSAK
ncbi:MAG: low affinity iron permease family protein [Verrucomicrobiae bacterium]|nr:low affinity iron permease family protein [Verrucomicrobiae bacterium]